MARFNPKAIYGESAKAIGVPSIPLAKTETQKAPPKTPAFMKVSQAGAPELSDTTPQIPQMPQTPKTAQAKIPDVLKAPVAKEPFATAEEIRSKAIKFTPEVPEQKPTTALEAPSKLGSLSAKYESSGDPGVVSSGAGDPGGKSYGTYQLASKMGSVDRFMNFLKDYDADMYSTLSKGKANSGGALGIPFDAAWKKLAKDNPSGFEGAQHKFIESTYYRPAADQLKQLGMDIDAMPSSVRDVLWSTSVQHGVGGAVNIFKKYTNVTDPTQLINNVYSSRTNLVAGRSDLGSSVKQGVLNRYKQESKDALAMLTADKETTPTPTAKPKETVAAKPTTATAAATSAQPTPSAQPSALLKKGDSGDSVKKLQQALKDKGYNIAVDGIFGNETDSVIRRFQKDNGLTVDGAVGNQTNTKLYGTAQSSATGTPAPVVGQAGTHPDDNVDLQAEINKLKEVNPADPAIQDLQRRRAQKVLRNPQLYDQELKDWAVDMDRSGWSANNYSRDYQAEINRIKKFNPADPRIQQLSDLRAQKIVSNPSNYSQDEVNNAAKQLEERQYAIQREDLAQSYMEAERTTLSQADVAVKQITDWYKQRGMESGGTAAAAYTAARMEQAGKVAGLEKERAKSTAQLISQQEADRKEKVIKEIEAKMEAAKTQAEFDKLEIQRQKEIISYEKAVVDYNKAVASAQAAEAKAARSGGTSGGGTSGTGTTADKADTLNDFKTKVDQEINSGESLDNIWDDVRKSQSGMISNIGSSNYNSLLEWLREKYYNYFVRDWGYKNFTNENMLNYMRANESYMRERLGNRYDALYSRIQKAIK